MHSRINMNIITLMDVLFLTCREAEPLEKLNLFMKKKIY